MAQETPLRRRIPARIRLSLTIQACPAGLTGYGRVCWATPNWGIAARVPFTFVLVLLALALTGTVSAHLGGAGRLRATVRLVIGGAAAMAVTFAVGQLIGTVAI